MFQSRAFELWLQQDSRTGCLLSVLLDVVLDKKRYILHFFVGQGLLFSLVFSRYLKRLISCHLMSSQTCLFVWHSTAQWDNSF